MVLVVSARRVARLFAYAAAALAVVGCAAELVVRFVQSSSHQGLAVLAGKFVLDGELTIPAWFSSMLILACAGLLGLIAWTKHCSGSKFTRDWAILAGIFVLMSLDELAAIHEMLIAPMQRYVGAHGIFRYGWVIPAILFLGWFAWNYQRFVFVHLDSRTRFRFIAAGVIYVTGALGMEMLEGPIDEYFPSSSIPAMAMVTIEESMEMFGMVIFLHALLVHLADHCGDLRVRFVSDAASRAMPQGNGSSPCATAIAAWDEELAEADAVRAPETAHAELTAVH